MTGIDTNILVRYLAQDDPAQSRHATLLIEQEFTEQNPGFISLVTIVETIWVLESLYALARAALVNVIERILQADTLSVQNEQEVFTAAMILKAGQGSFSDALIGALGLWARCSATLTFDRKASRLHGFRLLQPLPKYP